MNRRHISNSEDNKAAQRFFGKIDFERATVVYRYRKDEIVQKVIHAFKYHGYQDLAFQMGEYSVTEIRKNDPLFFDSEIDYVVPVPLHPRKYRKRGYNQTELLAEGISRQTGIPVLKTFLRRKVYTETQTKKRFHERNENVKDVFDIDESMDLDGKHILLIDDVLTSGSTLCSCASAIQKRKGVKISIFALAMAR
jgi:ComF family protein